jgi:hypothetical protein
VGQAPNAALQGISLASPDIFIKASGNLSMTSTRIASLGYRGNIDIQAGNTVDVGSQESFFGDPDSPKGIYTASGGSISVFSVHDLNVNGSRIATYNGGSIIAYSQLGDVNAGSGNAGYVSINAIEPDGFGGVHSIATTIPGSGILATTLPESFAALGSITVKAPNGAIRASTGGIIQLAFNGSHEGNPFISLDAIDIESGSSGIIGRRVDLHATGQVQGLIYGTESVNIVARDIRADIVSGGAIGVVASGSVAGTITSSGNVEVSASSISANISAKSVSAAGDTSGSVVNATTAAAKTDSKVTEEAATTTAKVSEKEIEESDEQKKTKGNGPVLAKSTGRVTVILPNNPK